MKYIREQKNIAGKTVLLRADLDEPHEDGRLLDDYRIRMTMQSIEHLVKLGCKIVIISKIGRPEKPFDPKDSLLPAAEKVAELLGRKLVIADSKLPDYDVRHIIFFKGDIRQEENLQSIRNAPAKDIIILENMRYYPEEVSSDLKFAEKLASLGDIYVNDAFAMAHRNDVSVTLIPKYLPSYAGLHLEAELKALKSVTDVREKPFVMIMGGVKISDKIHTLRNLGKIADNILIGGGLANLFFKAQGYEIGESAGEHDKVEFAEELLRNFKKKILLPTDVVVAKANFEEIRVCKPNEVKKNELVLDIGPQTILAFSNVIKDARKLIWNGPMGYFEKKSFSFGTMSLAQIFASRCKGQAFGVAGGGDTLEALDQGQFVDQIDFVSTGGGAMLDYLAGDELPALKALEMNK